MTKGFLTAVSALAIMASAPAFADMHNKDNMSESQPNESFTQDAKEAWEDTKEGVSEAAGNVSEATRETYQDIKASLVDNNGNNNANATTVTINQRMTASGMIGQPVYNRNGERIAKVEDIILNRNGEALMVVLVDGEWTGLGKMAAFDYNVITTRSVEGDIIAPLTEEMISNAASFSYDREDYSSSVKVIPSNGYSVAELLDAQLVNPQGEEVAEVDNISLQNGEAKRLIVGFGKVLSLGGNQAALDYSAVKLVPNGRDNQLDFKLSASQAQQFESFKQSLDN